MDHYNSCVANIQSTSENNLHMNTKFQLQYISQPTNEFIFGGGVISIDSELICNRLNRFVGDSNEFTLIPRLEGDNGEDETPIVWSAHDTARSFFGVTGKRFSLSSPFVT